MTFIVGTVKPSVIKNRNTNNVVFQARGREREREGEKERGRGRGKGGRGRGKGGRESYLYY